MTDHTHGATTEESRVTKPARSRRPLGWGTTMAVVGLVIFAVGLVFIGLAFDSMTVDQEGQWMPIYLALIVMAALTIGLALRSRVAHAATVGLAGYLLLTSLAGILRTGLVGPWQFGLISVVPAARVLIGLLASWQAYWRPTE